MIKRFKSGGTKEALNNLNEIVSVCNLYYQPNISTIANESTAPTNILFWGEVLTDLSGSTFTGSFFTTDMSTKATSGPFYNQTIISNVSEGVTIGNTFIAIKNPLDGEWYCLGIYD